MSCVLNINYRQDKAKFDVGEDDAHVSADADEEVEFVDVPQMDGCLVVDEAEHGRDDDGRQHHDWRVMEQWSQKQ